MDWIVTYLHKIAYAEFGPEIIKKRYSQRCRFWCLSRYWWVFQISSSWQYLLEIDATKHVKQSVLEFESDSWLGDVYQAKSNIYRVSFWARRVESGVGVGTSQLAHLFCRLWCHDISWIDHPTCKIKLFSFPPLMTDQVEQINWSIITIQ